MQRGWQLRPVTTDSSRYRRVALAITVGIGLVGISVLVLNSRKPSPEEVATMAAVCLKNQDGQCLYRLTDPDELSKYGLSELGFRRLVDEVIFDEPWQVVGAPIVRPEAHLDYGVTVAFQSGSKSLSVWLNSRKTSQGSKLVMVVFSLLLCRIEADFPNKPNSERNAALAKLGRSKLISLGINGLDYGPGQPFRSWDEFESFHKVGVNETTGSSTLGGSR